MGVQYDVWRNPDGLDGRDVGAGNFGVGKLVCKIAGWYVSGIPSSGWEGVASYMAQMPVFFLRVISVLTQMAVVE